MKRDSILPDVLRLVCGLWLAAVVPLSIVLAVVAVTWTGRLFAGASLLAGSVPLFASLRPKAESRSWIRWLTAAGGCWLVLVSGLLWLASSGETPPLSRVRRLSTHPGGRFQRLALTNLLPEVDQLMLGFTLMPAVDPLLTTTQATALKQMTASLYREMDRDPEFRNLRSSLPEAYEELWRGVAPLGQGFLYVPPDIDRTQPTPALVFFHGSGGNFKGYLWLLHRLADRLHLVVIAPSHGMGNWRMPDTGKALAAALAEAAQTVNLAPDRIHIMGLSNGGLAVSQLARDEGARYRSFIFLSPVFDEGCVRSLAAAGRGAPRSVLVISGRNDDRIRIEYVEVNAARLSAGGAKVQLHAIAGADHFLFFSHADEMLDQLESWLREVDSER